MKPPIPETLPDDVLFLLRMNSPSRVTKEEIANFAGYEYTRTVDRYVRESVRILRADGYPIVSSSGQAGYSYDPDKVDEIIADLESRIIDLNKTIKALRKGHIKDEQMKLELA